MTTEKFILCLFALHAEVGVLQHFGGFVDCISFQAV